MELEGGDEGRVEELLGRRDWGCGVLWVRTG